LLTVNADDNRWRTEISMSMTDEPTRDVFKHLTDDELMAAHREADARYCAIFDDDQPVDRASVVEWIVKSGELSAINWAYHDEWKRRGRLPDDS